MIKKKAVQVTKHIICIILCLIVIMPFSRAHTIMLQKKLIYTAVTRARRSLVLLGNKEAFEKGVEAVERHTRATTLVKRLKDQDPFS